MSVVDDLARGHAFIRAGLVPGPVLQRGDQRIATHGLPFALPHLAGAWPHSRDSGGTNRLAPRRWKSRLRWKKPVNRFPGVI